MVPPNSLPLWGHRNLGMVYEIVVYFFAVLDNSMSNTVSRLVLEFLHITDQVSGRTICTPNPLLTVNLVLLEEMIRRLGSEYTRLSPKWRMFLHSFLYFISS